MMTAQLPQVYVIINIIISLFNSTHIAVTLASSQIVYPNFVRTLWRGFSQLLCFILDNVLLKPDIEYLNMQQITIFPSSLQKWSEKKLIIEFLVLEYLSFVKKKKKEKLENIYSSLNRPTTLKLYRGKKMSCRIGGDGSWNRYLVYLFLYLFIILYPGSEWIY